MEIDLLIKNVQEREVKVDKDRLDRIKKNIQFVPEEDRLNVFDCFKEGYIIVSSEGYAIHKPYLEATPNDKTS